MLFRSKAEWKNETNKETNKEFETEDSWTEKVEQIRIYSGAEYQAVNEVSAGMICAVTGLTKTQVGEGL